MVDLIANDVLVACVVAWGIAQVSKPVLHYVHTRRFNLRFLLSAGGMPSSHSAVVVALATRIGLETGLSSIPFALAAVFAAVVMYDAAGNVFDYTVSWTRLVQPNTAPLEEIFGQGAGEEITLITCGGEFDPATRTYVSRWVVRAVRADPPPAATEVQ